MRPLNIGHLQFLRELDSPFVTGGEADIEDLILATFVCAQSHTLARRTVSAWWARPFVRLWGCAVWLAAPVWTFEAAKLRKHLESCFGRGDLAALATGGK